MQLSERIRNAQADQINAAAPAKLLLLSGSEPKTCATPDAGARLVTLELPAGWLLRAERGAVRSSGPLKGLAERTGDIGHFRLVDKNGLCDMQGSVTDTDGGGDIEVSHRDVSIGQEVVVKSFRYTRG